MKHSPVTFEELVEKLRKAAETWFSQDLQIDLERLILIATLQQTTEGLANRLLQRAPIELEGRDE